MLEAGDIEAGDMDRQSFSWTVISETHLGLYEHHIGMEFTQFMDSFVELRCKILFK